MTSWDFLEELVMFLPISTEKCFSPQRVSLPVEKEEGYCWLGEWKEEGAGLYIGEENGKAIRLFSYKGTGMLRLYLPEDGAPERLESMAEQCKEALLKAEAVSSVNLLPRIHSKEAEAFFQEVHFAFEKNDVR